MERGLCGTEWETASVFCGYFLSDHLTSGFQGWFWQGGGCCGRVLSSSANAGQEGKEMYAVIPVTYTSICLF